MKKLLFLIPLLLTNLCHADSKTSGSLGLVKPTTGYVDKTQSWASKINNNFDIIDSSFGIVAAMNISTSALKAKVDTLCIDTATLALATATLSTTKMSSVSVSGLTPGAYTNTNLTVDLNGRVVKATNGTEVGVYNSTVYLSSTIGNNSTVLTGIGFAVGSSSLAANTAYTIRPYIGGSACSNIYSVNYTVQGNFNGLIYLPKDPTNDAQNSFPQTSTGTFIIKNGDTEGHLVGFCVICN